MSQKQISVLGLYLKGCALVFGYICMVTMLIMWVLQAIAIGFGESYDWAEIYKHLILYTTFLAFFPGQPLWTVRLQDAQGRWHTIIGRDD